ncbi:GGDEF domain-containing protein [Pseudomonas jilinensis]|uniref:diguanylate cyclase n=2 Tax=Pseudomonas jilinensis TaxID=2078689 RepID=A0A396S6J9_9PSED|nr:GGDEF domain-containing protein [Pseudomonas jilinensis]
MLGIHVILFNSDTHNNNAGIAGQGCMAETDAALSYQLSTWRGEFVEPEVEQAFRRHIERSVVRHLRVAVLVWAILLLLFGGLDYLDLGWSDGFLVLMSTRILQAALLLAFAWRLGQRPELATTGYAVTALEALGFVLFFLIYFARPDIVIWNIGVTLIMLISMFIFIPSRVYPTLLAALFGIAGTLYCLALTGLSTGLLVGVSFILMLPVVVGFVAALRLQLVQRHEFALYTEVAEANRELKAEIERREALELELKRQATTDPLTGLFNRRQYEMLFVRERERCRRQNSPMCLCIADLDHFKALNDKLGHDAGDAALRHVASLFARHMRQSDVLGRFGGEEFIMLLPDTDEQQAGCMVERLRQALEQSPLLLSSDRDYPLTATFAVTRVQDDEKTIRDTIRRADKGLYQGKRAGRNRVVLA